MNTPKQLILQPRDHADPSPAIWIRPEVKFLGNLADIVRGGGGKLSITGGDPGEMRKQIGQE